MFQVVGRRLGLNANTGASIPSIGTCVAGEKNVAVTSRQVTLIGVASSAGTHHAGQDQAPTALRAAGLPSGSAPSV
jgi:arginase family enzyme